MKQARTLEYRPPEQIFATVESAAQISCKKASANEHYLEHYNLGPNPNSESIKKAETGNIKFGSAKVKDSKQSFEKLAKNSTISWKIRNSTKHKYRRKAVEKIMKGNSTWPKKPEICQTLKTISGISARNVETSFLTPRTRENFHQKVNFNIWGFLFEKHSKHKRPRAQGGSLMAQRAEHFTVKKAWGSCSNRVCIWPLQEAFLAKKLL